MSDIASNGLDRTTNFLRRLGWGLAALIMVVPLVGMQLSPEIAWSPGDFLFAAFMLGAVGFTLELVVRTRSDWSYRIAAITALGTAFVTVWGNLAVGFVGSEDNPANGLFFLVLLVALFGSLAARFRPTGMAMAMAAAAVAQVAVGVAIGWQSPSADILVVTLVFTMPWLLASGLFRKAGEA